MPYHFTYCSIKPFNDYNFIFVIYVYVCIYTVLLSFKKFRNLLLINSDTSDSWSVNSFFRRRFVNSLLKASILTSLDFDFSGVE